MNKTDLFRAAAIESNRAQWLGKIVLVRPLSLTICSVGAGLIIITLVTFLLLGSYTRRTTVRGQLSPVAGIVRVFAPQPGIILKKNVEEGQPLKKGDVLYLISSERQNSSAIGIESAISKQVKLRLQYLRDELDQTSRLQQEQEQALQKKLKGLTRSRIMLRRN